jgi:hypothetical protein
MTNPLEEAFHQKLVEVYEEARGEDRMPLQRRPLPSNGATRWGPRYSEEAACVKAVS